MCGENGILVTRDIDFWSHDATELFAGLVDLVHYDRCFDFDYRDAQWMLFAILRFGRVRARCLNANTLRMRSLLLHYFTPLKDQIWYRPHHYCRFLAQ